MDGLLIDSEPLWRRAEKKVFRTVGVELSEAQCEQTMGWRIDEVVDHWHHRFPWKEPSREALTREILLEVQRQIESRGEALPGACEAVRLLHEWELPLAVASSSPVELIDAVLHRLGIHQLFASRHSAMQEKRGKPYPDVFLTAARQLDVEPSSCVVFEDSPVGVQAARRAGMRVIAVPSKEHLRHPTMAAADLCWNSLESLTREALEQGWLRFGDRSG
ncbi:MAG: hexitol phosphatase HxpB [Deltaproteobacteria bacterium]|nr:hexitol phosphatase HxpB [Deltaproteobacteria bacterium]